MSFPRLFESRCNFSVLSFSLCWLVVEASENIGHVRATRSQEYESLHHHKEESCPPTRDTYTGLLHEHERNVCCVTALNFYSSNVTFTNMGEDILQLGLLGGTS